MISLPHLPKRPRSAFPPCATGCSPPRTPRASVNAKSPRPVSCSMRPALTRGSVPGSAGAAPPRRSMSSTTIGGAKPRSIPRPSRPTRSTRAIRSRPSSIARAGIAAPPKRWSSRASAAKRNASVPRSTRWDRRPTCSAAARWSGRTARRPTRAFPRLWRSRSSPLAMAAPTRPPRPGPSAPFSGSIAAIPRANGLARLPTGIEVQMSGSQAQQGGMIGRRLSHYRVLAPLGSGGMGVVYRARDEHLDRDVALKVLPEKSLTDESSRARFRGEALALSRLNHPGIGMVFDFDRQDGTDFLVMEFVPGTTLAARLSVGTVSEEEALALGLQIAEALESAHEQGIVHRDLKPANVMVTGAGRVKILDFGIALLRAERDRATTGGTRAHALLGTLSRMSPEQMAGREVDGRADIFAAGLVLYQMLTGRHPFPYEGEAALINAILNEPPAPPRRLRPELSPGTEALVLRCLEKDPDHRFPSARELARELRELIANGGRAASAQPRRVESIAVLPLENLSGDAA